MSTSTWSTSTATTAPASTRRGSVRRWLSKLRPRLRHSAPSMSSAASFTKTYPDYVLGDDRGPSQYDATWTRARAVHVAPAPPAAAAASDDDYVDFMRNRRGQSFRREREPRYLSFSNDVDLDAIDLSAPAKRRLSFRWSDLARSHSLNR